MTRASPTFPPLNCMKCGAISPKRGAMQKYCESCSRARHLERQRKWARDHRGATTAHWLKRETAA